MHLSWAHFFSASICYLLDTIWKYGLVFTVMLMIYKFTYPPNLTCVSVEDSFRSYLLLSAFLISFGFVMSKLNALTLLHSKYFFGGILEYIFMHCRIFSHNGVLSSMVLLL